MPCSKDGFRGCLAMFFALRDCLLDFSLFKGCLDYLRTA